MSKELKDKLAEKKLTENAIITELKINHDMEQLQADIKAQQYTDAALAETRRFSAQIRNRKRKFGTGEAVGK